MKNFLIGLLISAGLMLATQAQSAPVDFEDLHADGDLTALSSPYAGLNWGEDWYYGDTTVDGYGNGAHSGVSFVTNGYGVDNLAVSSTTAFNLAGAWFAAPDTNGAVASWINITAYDAANHVIGSTGNVSIGQSYQWVAANFANVSRVSITRDDGWFVMDDFTVISAVPEPGSLLMLLAGLAVLIVAARKRFVLPVAMAGLLAMLCGGAAQAQSCGTAAGATVCLSAAGSSDNIKLTWTVSGIVTGVQIYRDTDSDANGRTRIAVPSATASTYTDTTPTLGVPYWYWVKFTTTSGSGNSGSATAVRVGAMRSLTSVQLSAQMSPGWNLGNSMEAIGGETAWGNPPANQALFTAVKAAGFKTVRIPLSWTQYADANYNISASWMARVKEVVDAARSAGLYVIINVHWDGGWLQPTYAAQSAANARLAKFWTQIATTFQYYDDYLLFAGTNEVMVTDVYTAPTAENIAVQNGFNQVFVNTVRGTGSNNAQRHLIVQGYNTNIDYTYATNTVPTDTATSRMMMEVHFYDPYNFTLNTSSAIWQWGSIATDSTATETWANESYVDTQFQKMKTRFVDKGVAVVLGEYAASLRTEYDTAGKYRQYWDQYITKSAYQHGLVPVYWDNGPSSNHQSGLFNRATGAQAYPAVITAIVNAAK
ncbi:cellulase family glycosylhydrolase [Duganella sp. FT135W]|uniref:Cellulase family glycosylhydrolase n=1 Tax=Duganella flavida TaxID=2692175 RepID=A0A6L8KCQ9_9BURK|nr:glycoside hydrolase family 5 protein [Duganella flavida]MYM22221.1 cellulase family glycosylhydrolase [Duganella flavida]